MVAYSFRARLREPILVGAKRQSIRADRKRHARPGEQLQLYTGMRTRECAIIARALCSQVMPVRIDVDGCRIEVGDREAAMTSPGHLDAFAQCDDFMEWPDMQTFWRLEHPEAPVFSGILIRWEGLT